MYLQFRLYSNGTHLLDVVIRLNRHKACYVGPTFFSNKAIFWTTIQFIICATNHLVITIRVVFSTSYKKVCPLFSRRLRKKCLTFKDLSLNASNLQFFIWLPISGRMQLFCFWLLIRLIFCHLFHCFPLLSITFH